MDTVAEAFGVIYGLSCQCHPERGVRYVGQTFQSPPGIRLVQHFSDANTKRSTLPVHYWIRRHGAENIEMQILESNVSLDRIYEAEAQWISFCGTIRESGGLNLLPGGRGVFGWKHSDETRGKMSQSRMGHAVSQETKAKLSQANAGRSHHTDEQRRASSERMKRKFGESHYRVKLKESEVEEIITLIWESFSNQEIADIYGVTRQAIHFIRTGKNWKHLERPWGDCSLI